MLPNTLTWLRIFAIRCHRAVLSTVQGYPAAGLLFASRITIH